MSDFPQNLRVRHQAIINGRVISTLYGAFRNGYIESSGLKGIPQKFRTPIEFAQAHKNAKIRSEHHRAVKTHNWNIIDYWDQSANTWKKLNDYFAKSIPEIQEIPELDETVTIETDASYAGSRIIEDNDDTMSFVTCISVEEIEELELTEPEPEPEDPYEGLPYRYEWKQIDTIEVWQWSLWATPEFVESTWKNYNELLQDDLNLREIEDELAYEELDREYPWITRHPLPHEEELWIATITTIPVFGEVWMDASGNSWDIIHRNGCLAEVGNWIGKWSWDNRIMDLGAKEPTPLLDDEEFWDVLQDFEE